MDALITQFVAYISGLIANAVTEFTKTDKKQLALTPEQEVKRARNLKIFNAAVSLFSVIGISYLTGDALDFDSVNGFITIIISGLSAWLYSQANYHLAKRAKINKVKASGLTEPPAASDDELLAAPVVRDDLKNY